MCSAKGNRRAGRLIDNSGKKADPEFSEGQSVPWEPVAAPAAHDHAVETVPNVLYG
jgi:hypothetical protein